ncbi:NUDIX domain protein [Mycobacterium xenopi 3993]|nr:NUDIX domain protein [Mycobacterium xenopi 3993]
MHEPQETVRIALVGKYVDLSDAYLSVTEALRAGGFKHRAKVEMRWVASDDCEDPSGAATALNDVHGVLIPGGFGIRGIEGKIGAIRYARARGLPVLGLCLGLQCIVIEAARSVGLTEANSAEFDPATPYPVISTMADQTDIVAGEADLGGTMRLGAYPAVLEPDSIVARAYQTTQVSERHRHRYEVNNAYREKIAESGLRFCGTSPDGHLVEFVEYPPEVHPFVVGTQAHPELKSRPTRPHPLFVAFVGAAIDYKAAERLPVEIPEQRPNGNEPEPASGSRYLSPNPSPVAEHVFETISSEILHTGKIFALRKDQVLMPGGKVVNREVVEHYGAVGVVALDEDDNIPMVYQYRHPFGRRLWELPAGLLDIHGEPPHLTAARELREEAGLEAKTWQVLVDLDSTPGFSDESVRVYLATGLTDVGRPKGHDEEADMTLHWYPLAEAVRRVFSGEIVNALAVSGILAASAVRNGIAQPGRWTRRGSIDRQRSLRDRLGNDHAGAACGDAGAGLPRPSDDRAGCGRQHVEFVSPRPSPLLRAPGGARH